MVKPINRDDDDYEYIELSADEELPEGFEIVEDDELLSELMQDDEGGVLDLDDDVSLDSLFDSSDADVGELLDQPIEDFIEPENSDDVVASVYDEPEMSHEEIVENEPIVQNEETQNDVKEIIETEAVVSDFISEKSVNISSGSGFMISDATEFVLELENEEELKNWQLLLWRQKVVSMPKDKGEMSLDASSNKANFVTLFQEGKRKMSLFNSPKITWQNASSDWQQADVSCVFGDMRAVKGLLMDELERQYPLQTQNEFPITRALLISSDVCCVFSNLQKYRVQYISSSLEDKASQNNLRWFSGSLSDKYHQYSASSDITEVIGDENADILYVSIGSSFYGWNIKFDNNIFMSLQDVQEFQRRNGKLPDNSGILSYGARKLSFRRISKIIAGRGRVQYFSYTK